MEPAFGPGSTEVRAAGRLVGGGGEARVAPAAPRSANREHALAPNRQVAEVLASVAVGDDGAERHLQNHVLAAGAVTVRALAVGAALGVVVPFVVVVEESRQSGIGLEPDAPAITAVATVGTAVGDILLPAEADAAGAPVAALDEDIDLVDEHARHRGPGGPPDVTSGWRRRSRSENLRAARTARSRPPLRRACHRSRARRSTRA